MGFGFTHVEPDALRSKAVATRRIRRGKRGETPKIVAKRLGEDSESCIMLCLLATFRGLTLNG